MTGLRGLLSRSGRDTHCARHGIVPRVHDGCMKCGAGTVAVSRQAHLTATAARSEQAEKVRTRGDALVIDVSDMASRAEAARASRGPDLDAYQADSVDDLDDGDADDLADGL